MAKRPTTSTLTNTASPTYLTQLNQNFTNVRNQFDNTLSLDGSTPNAMNADIDLNGNDLINANSVNTASLRIGGQAVVASDAVNQTVKKEFETVALLLADTGTYTNYAVDDYLRVVDGGFVYKVAASGASDQHVTTAGGVKLYVVAETVVPEVLGGDPTGSASVHLIINTLLLAGKTVWLSSGATYLVGGTVNLQNGSRLIGDKTATLVRGFNGAPLITANGKSNVAVSGFSIDGQRGVHTSSGNFGVFVDWRTTAGSNALVSDVVIQEEAGSAVIALASSGTRSSGFVVKGCRVEDVGSHGIIAQDYIDDVVIEGNTVKFTGMLVADRPAITASRNGENVVVSNNICVGSPSGLSTGALHGISIDTCSDVNCSGNVCSEWDEGFGIEVVGSSNVSVSGNTIRNSRYGIRVPGLESVSGNLTSNNVVIIGNSVHGSTRDGISSDVTSATGVVVHSGVVVSGNTVTNSSECGVFMRLVDGLSVSGNTVRRSTRSGLQILDCVGHYIDANHVFENNIETIKSVVSATASGSTVTMTVTAHGYTTGDYVSVWGAFPTPYNGTGFLITVTGTDTFTYAAPSSPGTTPAVGQIFCAKVANGASGLTYAGIRVLWSFFAVTSRGQNSFGRNFATRNGFRNTYDLSTNALVGHVDEALFVRERPTNVRVENTTSGGIANVKDALACYMKSGKFVVAYNNAGTINYLSIPLDGSTTTWTNSSTAP